MWRINDPQGNEASKIKYDIVPFTRGRGLDIGCGPFKAYPHFIGVDNGHHWGTQGADVVTEATDLSLFSDESLDFVFSSHLLEHIQDIEGALKEWWRVIKVGGHLVLYLPHDELYPKVGEPGANPDHKHNLHDGVVFDYMKRMGGWDCLINQIRNFDNGPGQQGNEYSFFQVYRKRPDDKQKHVYSKPKKKSVCVVRYGGFGDMIQTSSIFPGLKNQGYEITVMTTPKGHDILKTDPHIDKFLIQDTDQVPNSELGAYWKVQARNYDKFINLSESVEGSLLALPNRVLFNYPKELRHEICNVNYLERTHAIAGVDLPCLPQFYETEREIEWFNQQKEKIGNKYIIVWCLSGSSAHKASPWTDNVVARLLLTFPDVHIVFTGDMACQILEGESWVNEPRVWCRSGVWSIRETLTFSKHADMVVGPETGVLNAVGHEDNAKVIMLSHSTEENLTKYWKNTTALTPDETPCYPCHQLHYGRGACEWVMFHEESGASAPRCAVELDTDKIYKAIRDHLTIKYRKAV